MKFTETHEWIKIDEEQSEERVGIVGISGYAQNELGEIVYVELPKIGTALKKGEVAAILESTKAASDVYAPVSGNVVAVNALLIDHPELINHSPENEGWLFKIKLSDPKKLEELLDSADYRKKMA